jgi:hypothetical protein
MSDTFSEFMCAYNDVLVLRKRIEKMRHELLIAESTLRDAERESSVLFRRMHDRQEKPKYKPEKIRMDFGSDWLA